MATQFINQATSAINIDGQELAFSSNTVTSELLDDTVLTLVKTQNSSIVASGGTITYTIVISNLSLSNLSDFTLEDIIPTGMSYRPVTFEVNGTAQTPTVSGQFLTYRFATLPVGETIVTFTCAVA